MSPKKKNYLIFGIITVIGVLGMYFRLKGLGKWPVAVDEYYIIKSVESILSTGLPEFSTGGYYERGLIYQYFTALLIMTGMEVEFSSRLIPVISNVLTLIPLYFLARKLGNNTVLVIILAVFTFSLWEIEFARFARMYSPFQLLFVTYLYCLYQYTIGSKQKYLKWLFILSGLGIFIFEGSIFLALLNFIAVTWNNQNRTLELKSLWHYQNGLYPLIISVIIVITTYYLTTFNFREIGQQNLYPEVYKQLQTGSVSTFRIPSVLLFNIESDIWGLLTLIPIGIILLSMYRLVKKEEITVTNKIMIALLLLLCLFNLFGLMLAMLIIFLLLNWIKRTEYSSTARIVLPVSIVLALYWSAYSVISGAYNIFTSSTAHQSLPGSFIITWKGFLNYPYYYETFVLFRNTLPNLTILIVLLMSTGLLNTLFSRRNDLYLSQRFLYFILIFLLTAIGALNLLYFDTRYFLFLYPLVIVLCFSSLYSITEAYLIRPQTKKAVLIISTTFILFLSEDFNLKTLYKIDSREINFRYKMSLAQKVHYYPRWDTRTPAELVNRLASPEDYIISNEQVNEQYLRKLDYLYIDYRSESLAGVSVDEGKRERWTGAKLIYDNKFLTNLLLEPNVTKWLIINTQWGTRFLKKDNFFTDFKKYAVFANFDSSAIVYKIPARSTDHHFRSAKIEND